MSHHPPVLHNLVFERYAWRTAAGAPVRYNPAENEYEDHIIDQRPEDDDAGGLHAPVLTNPDTPGEPSKGCSIVWVLEWELGR